MSLPPIGTRVWNTNLGIAGTVVDHRQDSGEDDVWDVWVEYDTLFTGQRSKSRSDQLIPLVDYFRSLLAVEDARHESEAAALRARIREIENDSTPPRGRKGDGDESHQG